MGIETERIAFTGSGYARAPGPQFNPCLLTYEGPKRVCESFQQGKMKIEDIPPDAPSMDVNLWRHGKYGTAAQPFLRYMSMSPRVSVRGLLLGVARDMHIEVDRISLHIPSRLCNSIWDETLLRESTYLYEVFPDGDCDVDF